MKQMKSSPLHDCKDKLGIHLKPRGMSDQHPNSAAIVHVFAAGVPCEKSQSGGRAVCFHCRCHWSTLLYQTVSTLSLQGTAYIHLRELGPLGKAESNPNKFTLLISTLTSACRKTVGVQLTLKKVFNTSSQEKKSLLPWNKLSYQPTKHFHKNTYKRVGFLW